MPIPTIELIGLNDDWEALYINGTKIEENHSVSGEDILKALAKLGILTYQSAYVESDEEFDLPDQSADIWTDEDYRKVSVE